MYFYVLITNMLKYVVFKYLNWLIDKLVNWSKLKLMYQNYDVPLCADNKYAKI